MPIFFHHTELSCALGFNLEQCFDNLLLKQRSPIVHKVEHLEDMSTFPYFSIAGGKIPEKHHLRVMATLSQQIKNILFYSGLTSTDKKRTGLFIATSSHNVGSSESAYSEDLIKAPKNAIPLPIIGCNDIAEHFRKEYGLGPHAYTISSACSSASNALIFAHKMLVTNQIDHAIVLGYDFFNEITALGFLGLELISPDGKLTPFDERRNGMVLGEGCASLLLSRECKEGGVEFLGGATNTDPSSLTAAKEDGSTIAEVIQQSLRQAGVSSKDVRAIKIHGTASLLYDEAESRGIISAFSTPPKLFALKPYIGHTLGASGAIETVLTHKLLEQNLILGNSGVGTHTNGLGVSLNQENCSAPSGPYLLNFFAFGGNNSALVLKK